MSRSSLPVSRGCDFQQKRAYPTKACARTAAARAAKFFGQPMFFYRCIACREWHLSRRPTP